MRGRGLAALATAILLGGATLPVRAEDVQIGQKGKVFSESAVTLKKGDAIVFKNDDTVSHNVFSRSDAFRFNLKLQKPGEEKKVVFESAGTVSVRCAIHPSMELEVTVEEE